jgi:hypothetical protein
MSHVNVEPNDADLGALPALTRHRSPDAKRGTWLPKFTEATFNEYCRQRAMDAWKRVTWEAGLKLPTQVADGRSRCSTARRFRIADVEHVLAVHMV